METTEKEVKAFLFHSFILVKPILYSSIVLSIVILRTMLLCVGNYFDYNPVMYLKLFNTYIRTICESDTFPNLKLVDDVKVNSEKI